MQNRFSLRFESGERSGETVVVPPGGLTLGRRPGNSVQILDASVSGRHAEIVLDGEGLLLRDLGSTNGTRVAGERISERRLAAGDEVLLGSVRLTLIDSAASAAGALAQGDTGEIQLELDEPEVRPAPRPVPAPAAVPASVPARPQPPPAAVRAPAPPAHETAPSAPESAGEAVQTISAERVARSRGGPLALIALVLVLAGGGAAAWMYVRGAQESSGGGPAQRAVTPVEGDLLAAGYSFEQERGGWESDPRSSAGFALDGSARRSGEVGLLAELEPDEEGRSAWALEQSPAVRPASGRALVARGWLESDEGAEILLGLRLESSSGAAAATEFWGAPQRGEGTECTLEVDVPAVYDRARALLLARPVAGSERGSAGADDVSLVSAPAPAARPKLGETELYVGGSGAVLFKIDRTLLSGMSFATLGRAGEPQAPRPALSVAMEEHGLRLSATPAQEGASFALFVEPGLASGGLATTGPGGYRTHQVDFVREGAESILIGRGRDLVRLTCPGARAMRGAPDAGGFRLEIELAGAAQVFLQTSFNAERDAAQTLARQARTAEQEKRLGEALALWGRVLDEVPFEEALVAEAESTRGRLEQAGHAQLQDLGVRLERARFFRLIEIFRRCRSEALELESRYAPSGVAEAARALVAEIDRDSAGLAAELDAAERARLTAIEASLRQSGSVRLADRVRERLDQLQATGGE